MGIAIKKTGNVTPTKQSNQAESSQKIQRNSNDSIFTQTKQNNIPEPVRYGETADAEKALKKLVLREFKRLDLDGDLKVSKQEFIDDVINDYVKVRDKYGIIPSNIEDYIKDKAEQFRKHAGDDEPMNIDEYNIFKQAGN